MSELQVLCPVYALVGHWLRIMNSSNLRRTIYVGAFTASMRVIADHVARMLPENAQKQGA